MRVVAFDQVRVLIFTIVALLLVPGPAHARTIQVPGDVATIQGAINAAVDGDTVLVAPGIYTGGLNISGKTITLASQFLTTGNQSDIDRTIISGGNPVINVSSAGPDAKIVGFTITGSGKGIVLFSHIQVLNNRFLNVGTTVLADSMVDATYQPQPDSPAVDAGVDVGAPYNGAAPDLGACETPPSGPVRAFPGAEGFGANAVGGRGGRVIEVTNLNDSGPGSLRAAVAASGPRIVVFRVGGTIELSTTLPITNPFITIAGQTAPGGGITLKNHPANTKATIIIDTNDVIVRYLRVRSGPSAATTSSLDGVDIRGGSNIIIDHCSISWGVDENINIWYSPSKVTIQWSILSEALHRSVHEKGAHSKGLILGSEGSHSMSIHHNLFAHDYNRTPLIKTGGAVDVVNNVIYNWGSSGDGAAGIEDDYGKQPINFVGNYFKKGPDTGTYHELRFFPETGLGVTLYLLGNIGPHRPDETYPQSGIAESSLHSYVVSTPNPTPPITTVSAFEAFTQVLENAGVTVPQRDTVDERVLNNVRQGTGRIIDHPDQVGGWPVLATGTPPVDTDHDGMPDAWELARGLDPMRDDSAGDRDGDGYTNVEEYLNSLTTVGGVVDNVPPAAPSRLVVN